MAKLADACAGDVFARITDRLLAFGMVAGRTEEGAGAEPLDIVPMTIPMLDVDAIPLERLLAFRRKEQSERLGGDLQSHAARLCGKGRRPPSTNAKRSQARTS